MHVKKILRPLALAGAIVASLAVGAPAFAAGNTVKVALFMPNSDPSGRRAVLEGAACAPTCIGRRILSG